VRSFAPDPRLHLTLREGASGSETQSFIEVLVQVFISTIVRVAGEPRSLKLRHFIYHNEVPIRHVGHECLVGRDIDRGIGRIDMRLELQQPRESIREWQDLSGYLLHSNDYEYASGDQSVE